MSLNCNRLLRISPPPTETKDKVLTGYTVQPGDTPENLAQKFGLQGEEAQTFIKHLKTQTNKKGWFVVGQKITLLGEHSETIKNMADYSEDNAVLQTRWAESEYGQKTIAAEERKKAEQMRREAEAKPKAAPAPPIDLTPANQRVAVNNVRNNAKNAAAALKEQIQGASLNSNTRSMLSEKVKTQNVAYILESYPDLVTDIDDEWGMDIADVKKYVIGPLNSRLRELGLNKHCIPNDLSKLNISQVKQLCAKNANLIRQTDNENGYVFKPQAGNEGKIHRPRRTSQNAHFAAPTAKKSVSTPADTTSASKPAETKPKENDNWKYLSMSEMSTYPENLQEKLVELRRYGIEVKVTPTRNGYRLDLDENANNLERFTRPMFDTNSPIPSTLKNGVFDILGDKKSLIFDKEGNLIQQNQQYSDKTIVTSYDSTGEPVASQIKYKSTVSYSTVDKQRTVNDKVATTIGINRPEHLNEDGLIFADSLEDNKEALMKRLRLTNEQYNNLANLAMGIAEQETHFGAKQYTTRNGEQNTQWRNMAKQTMDAVYYTELLPDFLKDTVFNAGGMLSSSVEEYYKKYTDGTKSYGMSQVKVDEFIKDNPVLKKQFAAFGIKSGEDIRKSPEKQAIATMIILNNKRIVAESQIWQQRLADNNANLSDSNQQITENDLIALLYNGNSAKLKLLKEGKLTINNASYARNVRAYTEHYYNVSENQVSRNRADSLGAESQGNNGKLGSVIFMPTAYTTDVTNSKEDIKTLEEALNNNTTLPHQLKDKLLMAARKNEIAFGYGLTAEEAASITTQDVQLILEKLEGLKTRIANLVDPAKIRNEAKTAQDAFRVSYLESRQIIVNNEDISAGSIIPALSSGDVVNERLIERGQRKIIINADNVADFRKGANGRSHVTVDRGQYYGFGVEADKGVNPYDANGDYIPEQQRVLAECASDVAAIMNCGGNCATGIKASLESAGLVDNRSEIGFANPDGSWNKCENAKDLAKYFSLHPEKFEEVKYVSLGNGTSRELNAADIKHLPAGYIGVFIPGEGFEKQAGHAFITNGNGQGYADEVDNLRWDDFKSAGAGNGKGEHGTYKIYRLKV